MSPYNSMFLGSVLILYLAAIGCAKAQPTRDSTLIGIDHLPVLKLPFVDFNRETKSPKDEPAPEALGEAVPSTKFVVRFQGKRRPDKLHFDHMFAVFAPRRNGKLTTVATCHVKPVGKLDEDVLTYEGVCEMRAQLTGPCIVEVRRGVSYWSDRPNSSRTGATREEARTRGGLEATHTAF
jgi:hypothetical protein